MGPAMEPMTEILNDVLLMWAAIAVGILLVAIVLALGIQAPLYLERHLRDGRSRDQLCRAFAEAVASGDLEAAEVLADLTFAQDVPAASAGRRASVR